MTLIVYYIPFFFLLLFFLSKNSNLKELCISFYICLYLLLILIFRFDVGWDYLTYSKVFYSDNEVRFEILSQTVIDIARFLGDVEYMYILFGFLTILPVYFSYLKYKRLSLIIFYICFPYFFLESFSVVRQAVAISFCILSYSHFLHRNKRFLYYAIIAVFFHYSAILFVLILLFLWFDFRWLKFILIFIFLILALNFNPILYYLSQFFPTLLFYNSGTTFGLYSLVSILLLFIISINKNDCFDKYYVILVGIIFNFVLINFDSVLTRLCWYFYIPFCFLSWSHIFYNLKNNKFIFLCLMLTFYSYTLFLKSTYQHGAYLPYKTILSKLI